MKDVKELKEEILYDLAYLTTWAFEGRCKYDGLDSPDVRRKESNIIKKLNQALNTSTANENKLENIRRLVKPVAGDWMISMGEEAKRSFAQEVMKILEE